MSHRVVFVESYPQVIAGQQKTLRSLLERVTRHGIEPIVLVPAEGVFADELREAGFQLEVGSYPASLNRYGGAIYKDSFRKKLSAAFDSLGYVRRLRGQLKSLRPDVLFCNDLRGLLTAGLAAKSLGIPVVIWDKLDKPHGLLDSLQLPLTTHNVIISRAVAKKYPGWQRRLYRNRIIEVSEGVDVERFHDVASIRDELSLCDSNLTFGIVGTVTHRKGHDLLMRAFQRLVMQHPMARLIVVGSWSDNESDREFFTSLPHREMPEVQFLGQRDDLPAIMNSIDILVVPSRFEGLGMVILEAMASGLPVIGARTGGIEETVIDGETGILVPNEDAEALFQSMAALAKDKALRTRLGERGRRRVIKHYKRGEKMDRICELLAPKKP